MVFEILKRRFEEVDDVELLQEAEDFRQKVEDKLGVEDIDLPGAGPKETLNPPTLAEVVAKSANRFVKYGFHKEVYPDLPEEEAEARYRADFALPENAAFPKSYKDLFPYAVVVDPRVDLARQHALAKPKSIRTSTNPDFYEDYTKHPTDSPYIISTHDGKKYSDYNSTISSTARMFARNEVGETQGETTAIYFAHPTFFARGGSRYSPGSPSSGWSNRVPGINRVLDVPIFKEFEADWTFLKPHRHTGSRGKAIIILGPQKSAPAAV